MGLRAFESGCNIIAFEKEDKRYGMCCAWSTMIGYEEIGMLIGSQSVTGSKIEVGDVVGVSSLSLGQEEIALIFGDNHSDQFDKFSNLDFECKNHAILIKNAKTTMICEVIKIVKLLDDCDDNFVVMKVKQFAQNKDKQFLPLEDVLPE